MNNQDIHQELPENFEALKASAKRSANWRERLQAVEELGQVDHPQSIAILSRMMTHDLVYPVQEAAYKQLKAMGENVQQPSRNKPELFKGISKIMMRIKKSLPKDHTYEQFKEKVQKMRIDIYDAYEGEKGADFDPWLEKMWKSLETYKK